MQRNGFPNEVMRVKDEDVSGTEGSSNELVESPFTSERNDSKSKTKGSENDWNHITKPGAHDVLLGRGGGTNNHSGNIKFRKLVNEHKMRYLACSKVEKPKVAREVVAIWRKLEPPGRFLARKDDTKRGPGSVKSTDNIWYEVGDKKAREKASQCLRERTPDVIPYIKHLREQQNAITEHGVSMVQMQMQQHEHQQYSPSRPGQPMMHNMHPSPGYGSYMDPYPSNSPMSMNRRNSAPGPYGNPMPVAPYAPSYSPPPPVRRATVSNPQGSFDPENDPSEMEYQQQMMMMHQNMMHQQMEMQRMQQTHHQPMPNNGGQQHGGYGAPSSPKDDQRQPPITLSNSDESPKKRSRNHDEVDQRVAPDRAVSAMSLTPANPNDNELSLEDYRQQLEEYIANCNNEDAEASDLEDDWERERDRALKQHQENKTRGVNRNVSGMSAFSNKSAAAMSLGSAISGFTDAMKDTGRENKMNMARSVCSNLSLMSELTDLSQNIDNLSLYDD